MRIAAGYHSPPWPPSQLFAPTSVPTFVIARPAEYSGGPLIIIHRPLPLSPLDTSLSAHVHLGNPTLTFDHYDHAAAVSAWLRSTMSRDDGEATAVGQVQAQATGSMKAIWSSLSARKSSLCTRHVCLTGKLVISRSYQKVHKSFWLLAWAGPRRAREMYVPNELLMEAVMS